MFKKTRYIYSKYGIYMRVFRICVSFAVLNASRKYRAMCETCYDLLHLYIDQSYPAPVCNNICYRGRDCSS